MQNSNTMVYEVWNDAMVVCMYKIIHKKYQHWYTIDALGAIFAIFKYWHFATFDNLDTFAKFNNLENFFGPMRCWRIKKWSPFLRRQTRSTEQRRSLHSCSPGLQDRKNPEMFRQVFFSMFLGSSASFLSRVLKAIWHENTPGFG